jgi:hypothetical protein
VISAEVVASGNKLPRWHDELPFLFHAMKIAKTRAAAVIEKISVLNWKTNVARLAA